MADPFLEVAVDAARRAGGLLLERLGTLRTIVYKTFEEDFQRICGRFDSMADFGRGEANYDGESLLLAARRLASGS